MNYSCEKCGMPATHKYIDKTGIVHYFAKHHAPEGSILIEATPKSKLVNISEDKGLGILSLKSYIPLIVIISLIIITSLISEIRESSFDIVVLLLISWQVSFSFLGGLSFLIYLVSRMDIALMTLSLLDLKLMATYIHLLRLVLDY